MNFVFLQEQIRKKKVGTKIVDKNEIKKTPVNTFNKEKIEGNIIWILHPDSRVKWTIRIIQPFNFLTFKLYIIAVQIKKSIAHLI